MHQEGNSDVPPSAVSHGCSVVDWATERIKTCSLIHEDRNDEVVSSKFTNEYKGAELLAISGFPTIQSVRATLRIVSKSIEQLFDKVEVCAFVQKPHQHPLFT